MSNSSRLSPHSPSIERRETAANVAFAALVFALVAYLCYFHPIGYVYFVAEDHWAEYGTFASFLVASCVVLWIWVREPAARKIGLALFGLAAFFFALEEISWGQRILGIRSPEFVVERNRQGEINLHNFVDLPSHLVVAATIAVLSIGLPLLTMASTRTKRFCEACGIPIVPVRLWPLALLAIAYFLLGERLNAQEIGEMCLGVLAAAVSLDLALSLRFGDRIRGRRSVAATGAMLLTTVLITAGMVAFWSNETTLKIPLRMFATTWYPNEGMHSQAIRVFSYIEWNPRLQLQPTSTDYARYLWRLGRRKQAVRVLKRACQRIEAQRELAPLEAQDERELAVALHMLGRETEAREAIRNAAATDTARLEKATNPQVKAKLHFSLAQTCLLSRRPDLAREQVEMAKELATGDRLRRRIERWVDANRKLMYAVK